MQPSTAARTAALIAYSEIGVKLGRTRRLFEERLVRSLRCMLGAHGYTPRVSMRPGRILVEAEGIEEASVYARIASRVFGVRRAAPVYMVGNSVEELKRFVVEAFADKLSARESFAIRVRRVEAYPVKSRDLERILGAEVKRAYPSIRVDLENPELLIRVEVRSRRAYVYLDEWVVEGPGGLPYGVEGEAAVALPACSDEELFSAWLVARRGARLTLVHRGCRGVIDAFIDAWVPCGDASVVEAPDPLSYTARLAEKLSALPVHARVSTRTLSPLEGAPREVLEKLYSVYRRGFTPLL